MQPAGMGSHPPVNMCAERGWSYKPPLVTESGRGSLTGVVKRGSQRGLVFVAPQP